MQDNVIAIVPAYNPGPIVIEVINKTLEFVDRIILVDDGSDDQNKQYLGKCAEIADDRLEIITLENNKGKGYALFKGLERCLELGFDYILTIDSDGQHNPDEIPRFKKFVN